MSADTRSIPGSLQQQAGPPAAESPAKLHMNSPCTSSNPDHESSVRQSAFETHQHLQKNLRTTGHTPGSVFQPADDSKELNLADFFDAADIQLLMDEFHKTTGIGMAIVDLHGGVHVATGWQDICTVFHRVHPETCRHCIESDTVLASGIAPGEYKLYKCKNNLWDMATPIIVGEQHVGNLFLGQFFFDDEEVDRELFRKQAHQYGFDETLYLAALDRVPRWSRDKIHAVFNFYTRFAGMIAQLSHSNLMLSRSLADRDHLLKAQAENESLLCLSQHIGHIGSWQLDVAANRLTWSDEVYRIFGCSPQEFAATHEAFIDIVHPEDRLAVDTAYTQSLHEASAGYTIEHRIIRRDSAEIRYVREQCIHERDATGAIFQSIGIVQDITEQWQAEQRLRKSEALLNETGKIAKIGGWELDMHTMEVTWTAESYRIHAIPQNRTQPFEEALNFCHPDDRETLRSANQRALENGTAYDLNLRFTTATGQDLWTRMICEPDIVNGKVVKLKGIFQDITEMKQAELKQLKHMEELQRWQAATMGREGRVLELKREVNELLRKAGQPIRYPSADIG